ncbi:MAG TPA: hypothetical protein VE954_40120 [Oligoflexus sp.]|uniref:hypothetical protein n=1 Tax=Oligoflexus sp. TaxID=1971216 RepID=UPI002D28C769|nr:hypothetical protein [Oligoflexus sp.]HYX39349.1 hypothetical protein [Oligoflexus sp.]
MAGILRLVFIAGLMLLSRVAYSKDMSGFRHFVGGALSVVPGFGLGHVVESRWRERGWIFTAGGVVFFFWASGDNRRAAAPGVVGYVGIRIWEMYDAILVPFENQRSTEIKPSTNQNQVESQLRIMPVLLNSAVQAQKIRKYPGIGIVWTI